MLTNFDSDLFPDAAEKSNSKIISPMSISDVLRLADVPIPWLIDNLLIQGGCSLLAAKPKVGKTTLSRSLALAVARGEPFLGQNTIKRQVLLMTLEDKLSEVGRHFRQLGACDGDGIFVLTESPRSIPQLRALISEKNFGLVIVDTMILGVRGLMDLNDYLQVSQAIAPYVHLARETESHIMFVHHLSKRERGGGDQILGSTALFGSVDSVLLLDRQKQLRTFSTIMRYGKDWPSARLQMAEEGQIRIFEEDKEATVKAQIIEKLSSEQSPITEKEIESTVYGRTAHKRRALRELFQNGQIKRIGDGTKSSPCQYSCSTP